MYFASENRYGTDGNLALNGKPLESTQQVYRQAVSPQTQQPLAPRFPTRKVSSGGKLFDRFDVATFSTSLHKDGNKTFTDGHGQVDDAERVQQCRLGTFPPDARQCHTQLHTPSSGGCTVSLLPVILSWPAFASQCLPYVCGSVRIRPTDADQESLSTDGSRTYHDVTCRLASAARISVRMFFPASHGVDARR
ncbi:YidC/Oxa1 family membrane protein insertase [Anopheles sinensis]|uniref:YidC/Oxa1 family membrane protein insertase n=1 Tax=Anopheles sinensis TaxID=74873 RepID=A0A084VKC0_ANOSI|nr:YidC/Oxa1 family membrane protein insertase [Anopheles sinensis]